MGADERGAGGERVEIALLCTSCGDRTVLTVEQARRLATGLLAAAGGMPVERELQVRGGDG